MSGNIGAEKFLDKELVCPSCGTIYLRIPADAKGDTVIRCSACNKRLGTWRELEASFNAQGGQHGVFDMHDGQIERKE